MKISVVNQGPTPLNSLGVDVWQIDQDLGRLQGGSSGAPYYNQNHQIIGQHWRRPEAGTKPICDITIAQGGRFDLSWAGGGTNATRLSNWLDPGNTGVMTTNTTNVLNLTPSISGDDLFCTTSSPYSIDNLPAGATVTWTATPSGIVTVDSPDENTTTLTKFANGEFTLTANVSSSCSAGSIALTKAVHAGPPEPAFLPYGSVCSGQTFTLSAVPDNNSISHYWTGRTGATDVPLNENGYWSVLVPANTLYVNLFVTNSCGTAGKKKFILYDNCANEAAGLDIFPNPATGSITVAIPETDVPAARSQKSAHVLSNSNTRFIRELYIHDLNGQLKINKIISGDRNQSEINISTLVLGIYIVVVQTGKAVRRGKLIVQ